MNIHTNDVARTCSVLAKFEIDFEVQHIPGESCSLVSLEPSTKWQDFMLISLDLCVAEFDQATNTLFLDDQ